MSPRGENDLQANAEGSSALAAAQGLDETHVAAAIQVLGSKGYLRGAVMKPGQVIALARTIHEDTPQTSQTVAFGSLSSPGGTLRILSSSTTRPGRLRGQNPQSTTRQRVAVSGARLHE